MSKACLGTTSMLRTRLAAQINSGTPTGSSATRRSTTCFFFFQAEDGIRDLTVTGVQTCALPIYQYVGRVAREIAVVLPVHEQQVHAEGGRLRLERVGHAQQHGDARCAVVRPGDGKTLLAQVLALAAMRPRVPLRDHQHPVGSSGPESGEKVPQGQLL